MTRPAATNAATSTALVGGAYATMAVMETVGLAAHLAIRLIAPVGGAATVPPAILAVTDVVRYVRTAPSGLRPRACRP